MVASDRRKEDWGQTARALDTCEQRGASKEPWTVEVLEGEGGRVRVGSPVL